VTRTTIGDAFALNPRVHLSKGVSAPFVDMAALTPFRRDVRATRTKPYSGGSKFCDGDVLMARITPSLENGKTSIYRAAGRKDEPAFGSTEFIVVRGREGVSDSEFAYYLLTSAEVRDHAIASMNGSSGRQRVQEDSLASFPIDLPALSEQRAIAATLGALDDKVESNRRASRQIDLLLAQLFRRVLETEHFSLRPLAEVTTTTKGISYKSADLKASRTSLVTLKSFDRHGGYRADGLKPYAGPYRPDQVIRHHDVVVAQTDLTQNAEIVGRAVRVPPDSSADTLVASLDLVVVRPTTHIPFEYLLGLLTDEPFRQHCRSRTSGTTVLHLAADAIPTYPAPIVSSAAQTEYAALARPLLKRKDSLDTESIALQKTRDALLPALLTGRIRVPVEDAA
jgi:type I restriction enzyme S subunit